ncbi:ClbS/DfsB family four-helix bundle protein [Marinomonas mediterranea]|uniref:ClbS/DfsB family four-helix bundle protein n=1 Tax=Marinomonas mediterranea (strain ATCC 700492 / JCM 21426 / NBRC 103028 / MMB-1) TaxID=717774 RepID=F2JV23_MARM1|nr:ClbS/DfsB family four-helix bundle protein [Marinomonas mediterranea]ADZ91677.1 protein of unknown function DUF1706 [Marinomonas mediterranea MMB-1]WCN09631.1 ClbS/DfsB family four-helix bundle protein [Marinomonas mediterranea]WCN13720.1 ClbS/DfsB family four-helix bundle protein [Marinomonas mediterranea]WCN17775.1 ClbS/DfsB family four-helix bundle protein [Marinomonas mediterranea MMB-1]
MSSIPASKKELESAIQDMFMKLMKDYRDIPISLSRDLGVEGNIKGTSISVCDTLAYLIGWGKLVVKWCDHYNDNQAIDFPETGFKWNQLGLLAQHFHIEYKNWKYNDLLEEFEEVISTILAIISRLSDDELYGDDWYENYTLGRMIQFNTSSPMKNIRTKVRRFRKQNALA